MRYSHYIFDLDGTLIDSFEDIFRALRGSSQQVGVTPPSQEQVRALMHCKLDEMIAQLYPKDRAKHGALVAGFKEQYDGSGFRSSTLYPGVKETLRWLQERQCHLYVATNKRYGAAIVLIRKFGLQARFDAIIASDQRAGPRLTKAGMLLALRREHRFGRGDAVFVGDTMDDCLAARECDLDFIMVTYGYGTLNRTDPAAAGVRTIGALSALRNDGS